MIKLCCHAIMIALLLIINNSNVYGSTFEDAFSNIQDVTCDANAISKANKEQLSPILKEINSKTFFRLFRVQLDGSCPLDVVKEEPSCGGPAQADSLFGGGMSTSPSKNVPLCSVSSESVDKFLSSTESTIVMKSEHDCEDENLPYFWTNLCTNLPFEDSKNEYVNLMLNPEQYTGYNGSHLWKAMYSECVDESRTQGYEEKFLEKLISGLHASINLHIAAEYYPPVAGKRDRWEPNLDRFRTHFVDHPERFKNLQLAYVVMLRAVLKAAPILHRFDFSTGNITEDASTKALVNYFLSSYVLSSCQNVFDAFDESRLFRHASKPGSLVNSLKRRFKDVFFKISELFNCVKCQKCRLHGKMQLLGIGTAIKILLVPESILQRNISREEIVSMFNTLGKFSDSIQLYSNFLKQISVPVTTSVAAVSDLEIETTLLKMVATSGVHPADESLLIDAILDHDPDLYKLAGVYLVENPSSLLRVAANRLNSRSLQSKHLPSPEPVIIIGGGLAGLTTALTILERGGKVIIIDKEPIIGGNSAKASSGMNGLDDRSFRELNDTVELFKSDMMRAKSGNTSEALIDTLTSESIGALAWLRGFMDVSQVGLLGGHSRPRTWRPSVGLAGSEMVAAVNQQIKKFSDRCEIITSTKVTRLVTDKENIGVETTDLKTLSTRLIHGSAVVIATGGFAADTSSGSLIQKYRPDLLKLPTTNGNFATGDGIRMAAAVGARAIDVEQIQVHPTAFIDPQNPTAKTKTLAAEILRGIGAVIVDHQGKRFVNELDSRKAVSEKMQQQTQHNFLLMLNPTAASAIEKTILMYKNKGLLKEYPTLEALAEGNGIPLQNLKDTVARYDQTAADPKKYPDPFGRVSFENTPFQVEGNYVAGWITPALHYCMGGLQADESGHVLGSDNKPLAGGKLFVVGESMGGLHGFNRLGGNSLTECIVLGRHVGHSIPLPELSTSVQLQRSAPTAASPKERVITMEELQKHNTPEDCWVLLHGLVYDFTSFANDHPAGAEAITKLAGTDGTKTFDEIHTVSLLADFNPIGKIASQ